MKNFTKKLEKITGEIRFKPTLTSWDKTIEFAKSIEKKFEHWRIDNKKDISLFSTKSKSLIRIKYDSILFLNEGDSENTEKLLKYVKNLFTKLIEESDVEEFRHIGCRKQSVIETTFEYTDLTDLTFKKFYANQDFIKDTSGKEIVDTLFVLDSKKDGFGTHIQIGPTLNEQAIKSFGQTFESEDLQKDKTFLFFDIDVFKREGINKVNIIQTLDDAIAKNNDITDSYTEYILK